MAPRLECGTINFNGKNYNVYLETEDQNSVWVSPEDKPNHRENIGNAKASDPNSALAVAKQMLEHGHFKGY